MSQRFAFFDIAGTLVRDNPWTHVRKHPDIDPGRHRSLMTRFLPIWLGAKVGLVNDITFRDRWLHGMAKLFTGWHQEQMQELFQWVVNERMSNMFQDDVVSRLQQHKQNSEYVILVTGMFTDLAQVFAERVSADIALGTKLLFEDGICSGKIDGDTCAGPRKMEFIQRFITSNYSAANLPDSYAYADSFSDQSLLAAVGHGVATYPDNALRAIAQKQGWEIIPG